MYFSFSLPCFKEVLLRFKKKKLIMPIDYVVATFPFYAFIPEYGLSFPFSGVFLYPC